MTMAQEPPQEEEAKNPYYEALSPERKAVVDGIITRVQESTDQHDRNLVTVLGGANFYVHQILLSYEARFQWLEQQLQDLESRHQRHVHTDPNT